MPPKDDEDVDGMGEESDDSFPSLFDEGDDEDEEVHERNARGEQMFGDVECGPSGSPGTLRDGGWQRAIFASSTLNLLGAYVVTVESLGILVRFGPSSAAST